MAKEILEAKQVTPVYSIGGELWRRVPNAEGQSDPDAVRAWLPITKGEDKGGKRIGWFRRVTRPLLSEGEAKAVADVARKLDRGEGPDAAVVRFLVDLFEILPERATTVID